MLPSISEGVVRFGFTEGDCLPASTIIVQYRDGSPGSNKEVVLGFSSGLTRSQFTDRDGRAIIEHLSVGEAVVYVSGRRCESFRAPGKAVVTLR